MPASVSSPERESAICTDRIKPYSRTVQSGDHPSTSQAIYTPLRILHISTAHDWRGGEQQILLLHRELLRLGHESAVFCPNDSELRKRIEAEGPGCIPCPGHKASIRRLSLNVRTFQPELIALHDPNAHTQAVMAQVLRFIDTPMVLHRKVDFGVGHNALSKFKYSHPSIRAVIAVSEAIREILRASGAVRAPIEVVRDGYDPTRIESVHRPRFFDSDRPDAERDWVVGTVAAFADHKDPDTFLAAARKIQNAFPSARFIWLGEGVLRKKMLQKAAALQIRFEAPGFVGDVIERMRGFDVMMYSSKEEGLGSSLIDAMALGLPIATTAAGGIPELFDEGISALLSPPKDSEGLAQNVLKILRDRELRLNLAQNAQLHSGRFTASVLAENTLKIYREVVNQSKSRMPKMLGTND